MNLEQVIEGAVGQHYADELAKRRQTIDRAYEMLALYGIPRERAPTLAQGIIALGSQLEHVLTRFRFVIDNMAWIEQRKADAGTKTYRLMVQNEDEEFIELSGWKPSIGEAIDEARTRGKA